MTTEVRDMATDELNVLLETASQLLDRDFHGIYAETSVTIALTLAFAAVGDTWRLVAIIEPNHRVVPLTSATREMRIQCAGALISLRKSLEKAFDNLDVRLTQAKREVRKFIEAYE